MKFATLALSLFVVFSSASAFAAADGTIGPAGCGLGNMIFGGHQAQVFAATTNGTAYNQLFGITTGTSNCGAGVFNSQFDVFVDSNKVALSDDAARGQGETIAVVSKLAGCNDVAAVGTTLKSNYSQIFVAHKGNSRALSQSIQSTLKRARQRRNKLRCKS